MRSTLVAVTLDEVFVERTFPGGILPVVSLPTARKRPKATVYATAL